MNEQQPMNEQEPQQSEQSVPPRRRLQILLAIPDSQRTEEQWEEINELEISLAPGNRADAPGQQPQQSQRSNPGANGNSRSGGNPRAGGHHRPGGNPGGGNLAGGGNPGGGVKSKKPFRKARKKPAAPDAT